MQTKLQEFSLKKYKLLPKYKFIRDQTQHNPIFKVEVSIPNSKPIQPLAAQKRWSNKMLQKNFKRTKI